MKASAGPNRTLLLRMTFIVAVLVSLNSAINLSGAGGIAVALGAYLLINVVYVGMVAVMVMLPERAEGAGQLWAGIRPVLAVMLWTSIVSTVAVVAGFILLVIPALIIGTIWFVALQSALVEKLPVFGALKRSQDLTLKNFWRVLLAVLFTGLVTVVAYALAVLVTLALGTGVPGTMAATFLGALIAYPISALMPACLYKALVQKETAELEAARQAAAEPHEAEASATETEVL